MYPSLNMCCLAKSISQALPARKNRRRAFTLIEATACLLLVALAMTIATMSLRAGRSGIGLEAAIVELQQQDRLMRDRASRQGISGALEFDLTSGRVFRYELGPVPRRTPLEAFGDSVRLKAVRATQGESEDHLFRLHCVDGRTPTYAVLVAAGQKERWLVVSGLTGAFETIDDKSKVADIFAFLQGVHAR